MEKMKSFNAGTKCTLKEPVFCPDNGETLKTRLGLRKLRWEPNLTFMDIVKLMAKSDIKNSEIGKIIGKRENV